MPTTEPPLRRLPGGYLLAAYAEHAASTAALALATLVSRDASSTWLGGWAWPLLGALLLARLVSPAWTWASVSFAWDDRRLRTERGLLLRRRRSVEWAAVAAVEVDRSWAQRFAGVATVTVVQGGADAVRTRLPGVPTATADRMAALCGGVGAADAGRDAAPATPSPPDRVLYAAQPSDLLVAGLVYGRAATVGAAAAAAVVQGLRDLGVGGLPPVVADAPPAVLALAAAVLVLALGCCGTAWRFAGMRTAVRGSDVVLAYGFASTRERVVPADAVVGAEVRRNLLELASGRVRVSLITTDSATRLGSNLVLPSLREGVAAQLLRGPLLGHVAAHAEIAGARRRAATGAVVGGVLVLLGAGLTWTAATAAGGHPVWSGVGAVVVGLLVHAVGSAVQSRLHVDAASGSLSVSTAFGSYRLKVLAPSAVRLLSSVHWRRRPLAHRLHYYAGAARALTAARCDPVDVEWLTAEVALAPVRALERTSS